MTVYITEQCVIPANFHLTCQGIECEERAKASTLVSALHVVTMGELLHYSPSAGDLKEKVSSST